MIAAKPHAMIVLSAALLGLGGCQKASSSTPAHHPIAVSNAFLEAAVGDLLGGELGCYTLAGPRMCPGHFDLRPAQMADLRQCRLLLRFDFQQALDRKLEELRNDGLEIVAVKIAGGLCEPESYLDACRQIGEALVAHQLLTRDQADKRLQKIETRMTELTDWCHREIVQAALKDKPVLTSGHQADLCRWLGLNVAGTFSSADTASSTQIDRVIEIGRQTHPIAIIANRPEGTKLAERLAERLNAPLVVFDNFPAIEGIDHPFDQLVRDNVSRLLEKTPS